MRKPLSNWVQLLACLISATIRTCAGQDHERRDRHGNLQFDPDNATTKSCWIPPYQDADDFIRPREGLCRSDSMTLEDISHDDLHALAVEYAPVLFFHPLEKYTLSSVNYTFSQTGRIWNTNGERYIVDDTLNMTVLLQTTRDEIWSLSSNKFYFETDIAYEMYDSPVDALYGDGYYSDGRSKATVYYNVYEAGNNTWAFNYFLYYPYNGEGNLGVLSTYEGVDSYTRFTLKPYGVHEGDWENVAVLICPPSRINDDNPSTRHEHDDVYVVDWEDAEEERRQVGNYSLRTPLGIHYRQHSWSELKDCTRGECSFYRDTHHPVGFAAFNSHATYPQSVADTVYADIDVGFFFSLQSFLVVDRTPYKKEDGSYNYFFPTVENMERLLDPHSLRVYPKGLSALFEPYYWQGYGGLWGYSGGMNVDPQPPLCLNSSQTGYVACPTQEEDPVFNLVMQFMAVYPTTTTLLSAVQSITSQIAGVFAEIGKGPEGPVAKGYFERWIPPKKAPFWDGVSNTSMTAEFYCEMTLTIQDTYREYVEEAKYDFWWEIIVAVIMAGVLTIINIAVPVAAALCFNKEPYQPVTFDSSGVPVKPNKIRYGSLRYSVGAITFTFFFFCMTASGLSFISASQGLITALKKWVPWLEWTMAENAMQWLCLAIILANTFLLVLLWLQVFEMRNMIQGTYYKVMGDSARSFDVRTNNRYVAWNPSVVDVLMRCCFGLLFLSLILSMVCAMIGMATVGFAFATVTSCSKVTGSVSSYCLDLTFFGMERIACGDDFRAMCSDWAAVDSQQLWWSAFGAFISHFYLVGSCGYAMQQRSSIPAILAKYNKPFPAEVVNGVLKCDSFDSPPRKPDAEEPSNVRFSLPRRNRPNSPIICEPMSPITTKTLICGKSPDSGKSPESGRFSPIGSNYSSASEDVF